MVSYEELIYNFVDIYLRTAMECSICKENYMMTDDTEFLDEYMKFFSSLLLSVEQDDELNVETLKDTLKKRKEEKLKEFQLFLKRKTIEAALESTRKYEYNSDLVIDDSLYTKEIQKFYTKVFNEEFEQVKDSPRSLLKYMREKEECL